MNLPSFKTSARAAAVAALLGCTLAPTMAVALAVAEPLDITLSYDVHGLNFPVGFATPNIYDIIIYNAYANGSGSEWPNTVNAGGGTITDPFNKSTFNPPTSGLLLGLVQDLPGDAVGQTHMVLMMDDTAAQQAKGSAWSATFPATLEDGLIADVQFSMENDRNMLDPAGQAQWDTAKGNVDSFASANLSKWFAISAPVPGTTTTSNFTVMAWSDGQVIGNGVSNVTTSAVPEPGTYALMLCGLAGVGLAARKKSKRG